MKRAQNAALVLLTMLALTVIARADVIVDSPSEIARDIIIQYLPLLLIGVTGVTIFLLQKFRKKK